MFILLIFVIVTTDQGIAANSSHSSMSTIFASTLAPPEVYRELLASKSLRVDYAPLILSSLLVVTFIGSSLWPS